MLPLAGALFHGCGGWGGADAGRMRESNCTRRWMILPDHAATCDHGTGVLSAHAGCKILAYASKPCGSKDLTPDPNDPMPEVIQDAAEISLTACRRLEAVMPLSLNLRLSSEFIEGRSLPDNVSLPGRTRLVEGPVLGRCSTNRISSRFCQPAAVPRLTGSPCTQSHTRRDARPPGAPPAHGVPSPSSTSQRNSGCRDRYRVAVDERLVRSIPAAMNISMCSRGCCARRWACPGGPGTRPGALCRPCRPGSCARDRLAAAGSGRRDGGSTLRSSTPLARTELLYDRCARPGKSLRSVKLQVSQVKIGPVSSVGRASPW